MKDAHRPVFTSLLAIACMALLHAGCGEKSAPSADKAAAVEKGAAEILAEIRRKAESGDAEAQLQLAERYDSGDGVPKDTARALEWYRKAAEQGNANAQLKLGRLYWVGDGVPKDGAKAAEWFRKAAEQGNVNAQFYLGVMYAQAEGVPKDAVKAVEWFRKAAEQGDARAQLYLGQLYWVEDGFPKDAAKAAKWFRKAAEQGNAYAQFNLGTMYEQGEGVPKDAVKAAEWFRKAAEQGHAEAQYELGVSYVVGHGVPKDEVKAAEWFRKAAEQGHAEAQYHIGIMHMAGTAVPKDRVLAYAWLNIAAANGYDVAVLTRNWLEIRLSREELAEAQRLSSRWKKGEALAREGKHAASAKRAHAGGQEKAGSGTAFVVSRAGEAVTNWHVVGDCAEIRIPGRGVGAKLVAQDPANDLALLRIEGTFGDTAPIARDPSKLRQGEEIVTFGFPLDTVLSAGGNLTPGVVSALTGLGNNASQIQITAPVQPGSSGSPVLNRKGEVVGVVTMKLDDLKMLRATGQIAQNVNFAVNALTLRAFLDAHRVDYRTGSPFSLFDKSADRLAEEARRWTLAAECWR